MLPEPAVPLDHSCSTLYNNTLYSYTPNAFQSLELNHGAQWKTLPMGIVVTGSVCVQATPTDNLTPPALYIVGGVANTTQTGYEGLQRYLFEEARWETITASAPVMQNRLYHSVAYLNASASILMYAGNQDGAMHPSSQTFTISTLPPYTVSAFESIAPPAVSPILLQWSESKAVMIGGSTSNLNVMLFSPTTSWEDSKSTLAMPLKDSTAVQAVIINGDDGSKSLYTFDMTVSPNSVNRMLLIDENGNPVASSEPAKRSVDDPIVAELSERDQVEIGKRGNLTAAHWPPYNSSLAPTGTRDGYSVARDSSGLVVISGGNVDDVLCMFKARDNVWVNASNALTAQSSTLTSGASVASTTSIISSTSSSTSTSQAFSTGNGGSSSGMDMQLLGAVIGSAVGAAIVLLCGFLFLRWRRNKRRFVEAGHQRRASGIPPEKAQLEFDNDAMNYNNPRDRIVRHQPQSSQGSFSSVAILMGRVAQTPNGGLLGRRHGSNGSDSSSKFNKKYKTAISNPIPQPSPGPLESLEGGVKGISSGPPPPPPPPAPAVGSKTRSSGPGRRGSTRRSSGWNRYWSGGSALNILGFGTKRATYDSERSSQYSDGIGPARVTQEMGSVLRPPNLAPPAEKMNQVPSGSPTVAHTPKGRLPTESMAVRIERSNSAFTISSYGDNPRDAFSSGVPSSVHETENWTPVGGQYWGVDGGRVPSNTYTESNYTPTLAQDALMGNSSGDPMSRFPQPPGYRPQQMSSDMSWVNLGAPARG